MSAYDIHPLWSGNMRNLLGVALWVLAVILLAVGCTHPLSALESPVDDEVIWTASSDLASWANGVSTCTSGVILEGEEGPCTWESIVLGAAVIGYAASVAALASCGTTGGVSCPAALTAHAAAEISLIAAEVDYLECFENCVLNDDDGPGCDAQQL